MPGDRTPGLQRHGRVTTDRELKSNDVIGGFERCLEVTKSFPHDGGFGRLAGLELAWLLHRRQDRFQWLGLNNDGFGGILGQIRIGRKNCCHGLTDVTQAAICKDGLAVGSRPGTRVRRKSMGGMSLTSLAVQTANTPGMPPALLMSTADSSAWA